jgi:hypothetical protein
MNTASLQREIMAVDESQATIRALSSPVKDLTLVNRAALRFLAHCEIDGMKIENCPAYSRGRIRAEIEEWR